MEVVHMTRKKALKDSKTCVDKQAQEEMHALEFDDKTLQAEQKMHVMELFINNPMEDKSNMAI
jgi:hypothetical protein